MRRASNTSSDGDPYLVMSDWQEIAARVAIEKDPKKVLDLAQELIRTLDAETSTRLEHITVDDKTREDGAA